MDMCHGRVDLRCGLVEACRNHVDVCRGHVAALES